VTAAKVTLSVAVMAHPSRRRWVDPLLADLGGAVEVVWDRRNDRWDTGRRALLAHDSHATHHLVVQDDAIVCRDLPAGAAAAAAGKAADRPVCLYTGRVRPHPAKVARAVARARAAGLTFIEMGGPWWGVAIVLPTGHIPHVVRHGDLATRIANYDRKISDWYRRQHLACWYTVPSLVDHRPVLHNPSLIAGRDGNRRAHGFLGCGRSASEVVWSDLAMPASGTTPGTVAFASRTTRRVVELAPDDPRVEVWAGKPHVWEQIT